MLNDLSHVIFEKYRSVSVSTYQYSELHEEDDRIHDAGCLEYKVQSMVDGVSSYESYDSEDSEDSNDSNDTRVMVAGDVRGRRGVLQG